MRRIIIVCFAIVVPVFQACINERELPPPPPDLDERSRALEKLEADLNLLDKMNAEEASLMLKHVDPRVRVRAARHMGRLGKSSRHFLDALVAALLDEDKQVRLEAADVLGKLKDERALEPLIKSLADDDFRVRQYSWKAIRKHGADAVPKLIDHFRNDHPTLPMHYKNEVGAKKPLRKEIVARFHTFGGKAVPALTNAVGEEDLWVVRNAIEALTHFKKKAKSALPTLIEFLENTDDRNDKVRVIRAFAQIGDNHSKVMPLLEELKKDEDKKVVNEAKKALKALKKEAGDKKKDVKDGGRKSGSKAKPRPAPKPTPKPTPLPTLNPKKP